MSVPHAFSWKQRIVVAMTGASGIPYARTMLRALAQAGLDIHVTISDGFFDVARIEDGEGSAFLHPDRVDLAGWVGIKGSFHYYRNDQLGAPIASGGFRHRGVVVVPCTTATLGSIAAGSGKTLVDRACDVALKEGRTLALLLRESPLSAIALENALKLSRAGAHILPTSPAFYLKPQTVQDMVDFVVARALDVFEVEHQLSKRWGEG